LRIVDGIPLSRFNARSRLPASPEAGMPGLEP
jgi:hypothetical protein